VIADQFMTGRTGRKVRHPSPNAKEHLLCDYFPLSGALSVQAHWRPLRAL